MVEVEILDAEFAALGDAQTSAVDERRHQRARRPAHRRQQGGRIRDTEDDRQASSPLGACRQQPVAWFQSQDVPAEEQHRAQRLVLRAGGHALPHREMRHEVSNDRRIDAGKGRTLLLCRIGQEPSGPIDVAGLRAMRVVAYANAFAQAVQRVERIQPPVAVDAHRSRGAVPIRATEELREVDAQDVLGLAYLPILTAIAIEVLAELAFPIGR